MMEFPQNFLWGAATSAHQVEGNNTNSDWWEWERQVATRVKSAEACDHYRLFEQDFDLVKDLNHTAHRFSVEWSRIEPQEGSFSLEEIEHYRKVVLSLRNRNIEPMVTLHHFTNPLWLMKLGGWENRRSVSLYVRYVERIVEALSGDVKYWITINEPLVYVYESYLIGAWPPQKKSTFAASRVRDNLFKAHLAAYKLIHRIYKNKNLPPPAVSIAKNVQAFVPCYTFVPELSQRNTTLPGYLSRLKNDLSRYLKDYYYNLQFVTWLARRRALDFIGMNYYSRGLVDVQGWGVGDLFFESCKENHSRLPKNDMGWDIYPQGLYDLLMRFKDFGLPLCILENGICTQDDAVRWKFIADHLQGLHRAITQGVPAFGYLHWSLMDNFEWDKGFAPRFGLIEVDYGTQKRKIRESAYKFARVCQAGALE